MNIRVVANSAVLTTVLVLVLAHAHAALAQQTVRPQQAAAAQATATQPAVTQAAPTAQQTAPIDLSGYWESVVDEDWRWRMLTAPKGDYTSVPLNAEGLRVASTWTEAEDGSCKAYGMAGLMRMPTDLHITWPFPNALMIQTDWGQQTRMLYFDKADVPDSGPTPQGSSFASWHRPTSVAIGMYRAPGNDIGFDGRPAPRPAPALGAGAPAAAAAARRSTQPAGGYLQVVTTQLTPGWLRRNGAPYGSRTTVTEYFQTFTDPAGRDWFDVLTVVDDPEYLSSPFITSSDFRRTDASKWSPHPCSKG